jgi:hypothetical protein
MDLLALDDRPPADDAARALHRRQDLGLLVEGLGYGAEGSTRG